VLRCKCCTFIADPELKAKLDVKDDRKFGLHKVLQAHILPLTNCAFNKSGDR
jgi:dynein assembly factor with WDR repeat domains 1